MLSVIPRKHVLLAVDKSWDKKITESLWKQCMLTDLSKIENKFKDAIRKCLNGEDKSDVLMYGFFAGLYWKIQVPNIIISSKMSGVRVTVKRTKEIIEFPSSAKWQTFYSLLEESYAKKGR
jgi:hypothetical protein